VKNPLFPDPEFYPFREDLVARGGSLLSRLYALRAVRSNPSEPQFGTHNLGFRLFRSEKKK
jgi:hypothetical protein